MEIENSRKPTEEWFWTKTADKLVNDLKLELAMGRSNAHSPSRLGGDPQQLFFLMSHDLEVEESNDDSVTWSQEDKTVKLTLPLIYDLRKVRAALNEFYDSHPEKLEMSDEEVFAETFLDANKDKSSELFLTHKACVETKKHVELYIEKYALVKQIKSTLNTEKNRIREAFIKEQSFPQDLFQVTREEAEARGYYNYRHLLSVHPVFGKQLSKINERLSKIETLVRGKDEINWFNYLSNFPTHVVLLTMRTVVTLAKIAQWDLDEWAPEVVDRVNERISIITVVNDKYDMSRDEDNEED